MIQAFGGDPILFSISTKNKTAAIGETVEIKVVAQLMDAAAANYFVFEELKGYTLKVVMPKNFIQTGGTYYDYVRDELTPTKNRVEYSIIGRFEGECTACEFKVLRGKLGAGPDDMFVLKNNFNLATNKQSRLAVHIHQQNESESMFVESSIAAIVPTNLRFKDPCVKVTGNTTFQVDVKNTGPKNIETVYAYLCYGDDVGLTVEPVTLVINSTPQTVELTYPVTISEAHTYVHVHFLSNLLTANNGFYNYVSDGQVAESNKLYFSSTGIDFTISTPSVAISNSKIIVEPSNCPANHSINWYANNILVKGQASSSADYEYTVTANTTLRGDCYLTSTPTCIYSSSKTINVTTDCSSLSNPTISPTSSSITKGESFTLKVTNCTSDIRWSRGGTALTVFDDQSEISVGQPGSYVVSCKNGSCPKVSEAFNPTVVPLKIEHEVPNNEIVLNQYFQLRAIGCIDGKVDWDLSNGTKALNQSSIYVQEPGLYKARCVSKLDNNVFSDWVTVNFTLKSANRPTLVKSNQNCVYANQTVLVNGTCPAGMTIQWGDGITGTVFPMYRSFNPGTYYAKCCNGTNCSVFESINICIINPELISISSNKQNPSDGLTYANPTEPVLLTGVGCDYGTIRWQLTSGQLLWGNPVTVYGSGVYKARCFVTDNSFSSEKEIRIYSKPPGAVTIISSLASAHIDQLVTLTAQGCSNGFVEWTYVVNNVTKRETGHTIDVVGPNTYTAYCISFGITSIPSTITVPQAPSNAPKIIVDKTRVRPDETFTFKVDYSGCLNAQWWGGQTLVTQNGVTRVEWGLFSTTVTGPATLEAQCADRPWDKQTREIFFAPADNLKLIANKNKAKANPNEAVLLTTYGCDYGFIEWQIGDTKIMGSMADPKRQITQYGPGYYKARCRDDFSINTDWVTVFVGADGSITPLINGPARMCPNTATTITTTGCPYGYYNVWNTIENGGWSYGGNSITIYSPQTVKLKCNKDDNSFASEEKSLLIEPAFPDDVKAKNNGPVVLGNPASITATDIPGATYLWTVPSGALFSNLNSRALQVASATDAYAGEYSVRVTYGSCALDLKTTLEISACENLYIKAYNPLTGTETNKLTRKPGVANKNEYEDLILEVQTLDGNVIKTMDYTWDANPSLIKSSNINEQYKAQTAKMGHYAVKVSKNTITCPLSIDIFAEPCTVVGDAFICNGVGGSGVDANQIDLANLAVGDEFTTSDYTIVVTEASGSPTGWTGKGKLIFNFLKLSNNLALQIPISVTFTGIKINQCYQLYNGIVITEYDPSWSSVRSISDIQDELDEIKQVIIDLLKAGREINDSQIQSLNARLGEIKSKDVINWDIESKTLTSNNIANIQNALTCSVGSINSRVTTGCDAEAALAFLIGIDLKAYDLVANAKGKRDNLPKNPDRNSSGNAYSICFQDKPTISDSRFDFLGESRYNYCLQIGEYTNFNIYKTFIAKYGLGIMADHLKGGSGLMLDFSNDDQIVSEIKSSSNFNDFIDQFQNEIKSKVSNNSISQINNDLFQNLSDNHNSPNFSILSGLTPTRIFVAMGGTQFYEISIKVYRKKTTPNTTLLKNYIFDYEVEFQDTYGADFDDINNTIKGNLSQALNSFFTLQHFYNGYKPYYTKVKVRKSFTYN